MPEKTPVELPADVTEKLVAARKLTLEIAELTEQVEAKHEARGALLIAVDATTAGLSYADIGTAIGVNRQRAWTLLDEAKHGSRQSRRNRGGDQP